MKWILYGKMNIENVFVRVNGRGNAWPVFLGGNSKFYETSSLDLSNASFSLIGCTGDALHRENIEWEVLIDIGHHTVPFLIQNGNNLPNAVVLTHGHMDHTLGLDWVAQSKFALSDKKEKLAVYATIQVWDFVKQSYPHLNRIIDFHELEAGVRTRIDCGGNLSVTAYPVYHGQSAVGASMLYFKTDSNKTALFTGDMLCPLLRRKDYNLVERADILFIDSNNRYPYPKSNHESILPEHPDNKEYFESWYNNLSINYLISPHVPMINNSSNHKYFEEFIADWPDLSELPFSVFDFCKNRVNTTCLVHFGGAEDQKYYNASALTTSELQDWVNEQAHKFKLQCKFEVPLVGDVFSL